MMNQRIQQNFSRHALHYDVRAQFQHTQTARVVDAALMLLPHEARILDIGCGTGVFRAQTVNLRPQWQWMGLDMAQGMCAIATQRGPVMQANAGALPVASASVDAVVSSLCLQWVHDVSASVREISRVLKPGGRAVLCSLVQGTLAELQNAALRASLPLALLPMHTVDTYINAAEEAELRVTLCDSRCVVEHYADVRALLDSMRGIGAGHYLPSASASLTGAQRWKMMLDCYEKLRTPQGLPATWHTLFMILHKPL